MKNRLFAVSGDGRHTRLEPLNSVIHGEEV
jgi:hypothetical protein